MTVCIEFLSCLSPPGSHSLLEGYPSEMPDGFWSKNYGPGILARLASCPVCPSCDEIGVASHWMVRGERELPLTRKRRAVESEWE